MTYKIDIKSGIVYASAHISNLPSMIERGVPTLRAAYDNSSFVHLQAPKFINEQLNRRLEQITGKPLLAAFVHLRFTTLTPTFFNIATGFNVTRRSNQEIVHVQFPLKALERERRLVVFMDRNPLSPDVRYSTDLDECKKLDVAFLASRHFRSPHRAKLEAGVLAFGNISLSAAEEVICVDGATCTRIAFMLHERGLKPDAVVDPKAFLPNLAKAADPSAEEV